MASSGGRGAAGGFVGGAAGGGGMQAKAGAGDSGADSSPGAAGTGGEGGHSSGAAGIQAQPITLFVNSIAVNTHLIYYDGGYADLDAVISNLQYLGVVQVRDALISSNFYDQSLYGPWFSKVAKAGIRFDLIANGGSAQKNFEPAAAVAGAKFVAGMAAGAVEAIEGFNEINNAQVSYQGQTDYAAAGAAMRALYQAVKADSDLQNLPVYDLTGGEFAPAAVGLGSISGHADFQNQHPYPQRGEQPAPWIADGFSHYRGQAPKVVTEFGYYTAPQDQKGWGGVTEELQAKLLLNGLADAFAQGVTRTYIYELVDVLPNVADWGNHWGLFRSDHSPKPAATAIHNLMAALEDVQSPFIADRFELTVSDLPSKANQLLFQKSDGTLVLMLWNEPDKWDETNHQEIPTNPVDVTVDLGAPYPTVSVIDPIIGSSPIQSHGGQSQFELPLDDHLLLVLAR